MSMSPTGTGMSPYQGGILTLDLSTKTGWCYGQKKGQKPLKSGVWLLGTSTNSLARPWTALLDKLGDTFKLLEPELVVMEAPLPAMRQRSEEIARLLIGLAVHVETICYRWEIECREQDAATARKATMGKARPEKHEIMDWCREYVCPVVDDNQADAVLLWEWVRRQSKI